MTEQAASTTSASNNASAPRNVFSATGIVVTGLVRDCTSSLGKDGKLYHDLFLITAQNPELKIGLAAAPDPSRYQVGSLVKVSVRFRSWQKPDGRSGMLILEVPA